MWKELMGQDLLLQVTKVGSGQPVQPEDAVVIDLVGRQATTKEDLNNGPIFHQTTDSFIVIGDKDVLPAIEMAVRFMHEGESAIVWSHSKFALGPGTRQHENYELPSDSNVMYEITVKQIIKEEEGPEFAIRKAKAKKDWGNDIYANEWPVGKDRAKYLYHKAVKEMEFLVEHAPEYQEQAQLILIDCLNNICAVELRSKEYHQAKETAVKVLTLDPNNFKGLIRAAKAALLDPASSYEEVEAAIDAAAKVTDSSNEKDVQRLKADFKRRKAEYDRKSKAMFQKLGKKDSEPIAKADETEKDGPEKSTPTETQSTMESKPANKWALSNWKQWPWWNTILPYGFQLLMPFLTYWIFLQAQKKPVAATAAPDADQEF